MQDARGISGNTQETFAAALDVSVEHYSKLESGAYGLQTEKMQILYKQFKIAPTYLITGEKNPTFDLREFLANCSREERDSFIG